MKRLLPAFLGLSLLLAACDQDYKPVVIAADDPRLLQGRWSGELTENLDVVGVTSGGGRLFVLDGPYRLLALDAQTGARLGQVPVPVDATQVLGGNDLAYRSDGRLLVLSREQLLTYDALTLTLLDSRRVPVERQGARVRIADQLSPDGEVLFSAGEPFRQLTRTGEMLPTASVPTGQTIRSRSGDDRWWLLEDTVMRSSDGLRLETAPQHPVSCPSAPPPALASDDATAVESAAPGGEQVLLGFGDGVVEVRDTRGEVLQSVHVSEDCLPVTSLRVQPDGRTVSFALGERGEQVGTVDLEGGRVTHLQVPPRPTGASEGFATYALPEGVLASQYTQQATAGPFWQYPWSLSLSPWSGSGWTVTSQRRRLDLDVQATRTSQSAADITGTAILDGRVLKVVGTLGTSDALLAPQGRPFDPVIGLQLTLQDGAQTVGRLTGHQPVPDLLPSGEPSPFPRAAPQYDVYLQEGGATPAFAGQLRRP